MPIPAELAPALRHLSTPLIAVADAWPFGRTGRDARRRMSVCPAAQLLSEDSRPGIRQTLAAPLDSWRGLWRRTGSRRGLWSEAGSSGPGLDAAADAGDALGVDADGADPFDAPPTRPWTPQPGSRAAQARRLLNQVAQDFQAALDDLEHPRAADLAVRMRLSTTLQELWHLRPDVFDLVAHSRGQFEAQRRLAALDRHFPSRTVGL
jgi:uncharacterized membrane protein